jgi:hypothetical protein
MHLFAVYFCFFFLIVLPGQALETQSFLSKKDLSKAPLFDGVRTLQEGLNGPRWVCSKLNDKIKIKCDDLGINELEGSKSELQINIFSKDYKHEYGLRHGIESRECIRIKDSISQILSKNKNVCFRGQFVSMDKTPKPPIVGWVFDEARSSAKSVCEFVYCD